MDNISCTVIIPTIARDEALLSVLNLLVFCQQVSADEIIVVDQTPVSGRNATAFKHIRDLESLGKVRIIRLGVRSLCAARNLGWKHSTGEILIYVDDDVFLGNDFVACHKRNYTDPRVVCITGQAIGPLSPAVPPPVDIENRKHDFLKTSNAYNERINNLNRICGGNFSMRRSLLESVGGFDENLIGGCHKEDIDMALRVTQSGRVIVFDPTPWIYHLKLPTGGGRAEPSMLLTDSMFNHAYFAVKHLSFLQRMSFLRKLVINKELVRKPWKIPRNSYIFTRQYRKAAAFRRAATSSTAQGG